MKLFTLCICCLMMMSSCKKFLEEKPDATLSTISSVQDAQALLDYFPNINQKDIGITEECADSYYLSDVEYAKRAESDQRIYRWEKDLLFLPGSRDWRQNYVNVFTADAVLESLQTIKKEPNNAIQYDDVKGQALLLRGKTFLTLLWTWSPAYDVAKATGVLGIPLRLKADLNQQVRRADLKESYAQVLNDLSSAATLLPLKGAAPFRGSKLGAWGWLARAYLSQRDYDHALLYADSLLSEYNTLIDYNDLKVSAAYPIPSFNQEIVFDTRLFPPAALVQSRAKMDTLLYRSYDANDLRKQIFFKKNSDGSYAFRGSYTGDPTLFSGIAVDELYLIKAECLVRKHQIQSAKDALGMLLNKRYLRGKNTGINNLQEMLLLERILLERRKELIFRGVRWIDIKRLNLEGADINLRRNINGTVYNLPANDLRYALAIPEDVVELGGIQDNPR